MAAHCPWNLWITTLDVSGRREGWSTRWTIRYNKHDCQMEFMAALQTLTYKQLAFGTYWYPIMCLHVSTETGLASPSCAFPLSDIFGHVQSSASAFRFLLASRRRCYDGACFIVIQAGCFQFTWLNAIPQCLYWLPMMTTLLHGPFDTSDFMDYWLL